MKILVCINSLSSGGAEVFAANLALAQKKIGHDIYFYTYAGELDEKGVELKTKLINSGVKYFSSGIVSNLKKLKLPFELSKLIKAINPDVIHSHLEQSDFFVCLSTFLSHKKPYLIRTIHNVYATKRVPKCIHRILSGFFDRSVACGFAVCEQYEFLGGNKCVIENGIDLDPFKNVPDKNSARLKLGIDNDEVVFLNIGAFQIRNGVLQKSQDVIIKALKEAKLSNSKMIFLGDGQELDKIKNLAKLDGVLGECYFPGRVNNTLDYLVASDFVVMPSRFEGLSIACIEAVCSGKPIVVTDIPSFKSFACDATIYVDVDDQFALGSALSRFIKNKEFYINEANKNKNRYLEYFSIERVCKEYMDLMPEL